MLQIVIGLVTTWKMALRQSLSHWRLVSAVVLGVVLASAIMAGTVIYYGALRELALKSALMGHSKTDLDIRLQGEFGPTRAEGYSEITALVTDEIDSHVSWMMTDQLRGLKSPTFFLATADSKDSLGKDNSRTYFAFLQDILDHVTIVSNGSSPVERPLGPVAVPPEIEAIVPFQAAQLFGVEVGDRMVAAPPWQSALPHVTVVISGIFHKNEPGEDYWHMEESVFANSTGELFRTLPFYVTEDTLMNVLGRSLPKMKSTYAWHLQVEPRRINSKNAALTLYHIEQMNRDLSSKLIDFRQTTDIDTTLRDYGIRIFFSRIPMFVVLVLITVVILYYVATLGSLVVDQRSGEIALLSSRGASPIQILTVFVLEGLTIVILAVLIGPPLAALVISGLGFTPAFSDLSGGAKLFVDISWGAYAMSAIGAILSFFTLLIPAIRGSRIGVAKHKQESARPARFPVIQRYYLDVLLLLISVVLFRQLTEQGSIVATSMLGKAVVNQLLLALPGLMLVASAMVLLRLFPLIMGVTSRLMSFWLPAGLVMGVWQMARNPTYYARLSLLLILTAGLGIFASSFGATLERNVEERILYSVGSDVRIDDVHATFRTIPRRRWSRFRTPTPSPTPVGTPTPIPRMVESYQEVSGVQSVSPVLRTFGNHAMSMKRISFLMFAVDVDNFSKVAWFREDFADEPMLNLIEKLRITESVDGLKIPIDARSIGVRLKPDRPHSSVRVTARIKNALQQYSTYDLGRLSSSKWTVLETSLDFGTRQTLEYSRPLTLVSIRLDETGDSRQLNAGSVLIDDIRVITDTSETIVIEQFEEVDDWGLIKTTPAAAFDSLQAFNVSGAEDLRSVMFSWTDGGPQTARGIFHGQGRYSLPVLVSNSYADEAGLSVGEEFEVTIAGHLVPVRLLDTIGLFPTVTNLNQKFLVANIDSIIRYVSLGTASREINPGELWISLLPDVSNSHEVVQELNEVVGYTGTIQDRSQRLTDSKVDPLVRAGWKALLFIAFGTVLILSCLGFLIHAYVSFHNRKLQFALLRTLGFSKKQLVTMVSLEQLIVVATGLALGTWMGGRLGSIIMPFLAHDDRGSQVVPPFAVTVNWSALLITYAIMTTIFVIIILGVVWFIQRVSMHRTLRIGDTW